MIQLSVIVPTYNERERLTELVEAITDVFRVAGIRGEVVIVDDNSPDGTGDLASQLACREDVRAVRRPAKMGLGSAAMDGFRAAQGEVLGVMDADFSHPPALLPRMLEVIVSENVDVAIASRYVPGGSTSGWPIQRLAMSRLACMLARPLTPVRDATSGFFLLRRSVISDTEIVSHGFKIGLELLVRGRVQAIAEVPYRFSDRISGQSKMTLREGMSYLSQLRRLAFYRLRAPRRATPDYRARPA